MDNLTPEQEEWVAKTVGEAFDKEVLGALASRCFRRLSEKAGMRFSDVLLTALMLALEAEQREDQLQAKMN